MAELTIKDYIIEELTSVEQKNALDFLTYLEERGLYFHRDTGAYWRDKIYYWVQLEGKCVCFIAINEGGPGSNHWTVWLNDCGSEWLEKVQVEDDIKEIAWEKVNHCGHCGSCKGGKPKVILGKKFDEVCGCTFRADNPSAQDIDFLKAMVDIRIKEIVNDSLSIQSISKV